MQVTAIHVDKFCCDVCVDQEDSPFHQLELRGVEYEDLSKLHVQRSSSSSSSS